MPFIYCILIKFEYLRLVAEILNYNVRKVVRQCSEMKGSEVFGLTVKYTYIIRIRITHTQRENCKKKNIPTR